MSATVPTGRKPRDIYEWAGGSAVNYEPVVIPASIGRAIDAGLLPTEAPGQQQQATESAQDAENEAPTEDDPQDADELPCGHAAIYAESGTCMVCDARVGAAEAVATRQQLGDDAGGGRL